MENSNPIPGGTLGDYRLLRQLGEGGMGRVYEAEHVHLGVKRAVKVFSSKSDHAEFLKKRFLSEGRILADLNHPRIVRVYDLSIDEATGLPFFAMDLVLSPAGEPKSLAQVQEEGTADERQIAGWFAEICEGLDYIHSKGVVHRDVSLENILIGSDGRIVISDFGISKIVDGGYRRKIDVTATMISGNGALCMGKGNYMAPELKTGSEATRASDAWALGVLLFRLLSGYWYESGKTERTGEMLSAYELPWFDVLLRLCRRNPGERIPEGGFRELAGKLAEERSEDRQAARFADLKRLFPVAVVCLLSGILAAVAIFRFFSGGNGEAENRESNPLIERIYGYKWW